jgi:hypothetical protein
MPELVEGTKNDDGKLPVDLVSPHFIMPTAEVLAFGVKKYEAYNWAKGILYSRVWSAMQRHLWAWWTREDLDEETRLNHLAHAACCLMFLMHYVYSDSYTNYDDRPTYDQYKR